MRRIFAFEGDGVLRQYEGGYTDYENRKREEEAAAESAETTQKSGRADKAGRDGNTGITATASADAKATWTHEKKLKFTFNEQKEYDTIDEEIAKLEQEIVDIDADMVKHATNSAKLTELSGLKEQKESELEQKMERWVYLNELAERIAAQELIQNTDYTDKRVTSPSKDWCNAVEVDFVATKGSEKYYIQSACAMTTPERQEQEERPLNAIGDSFKKIIVVRDNIKVRRNVMGIVTIGIRNFLLDENSLNL